MAGAAYAASYIASQPLVREQVGRQETPLALSASILDSISTHTGEEVTLEELEGLTQKMLGVKIDQHNLANLKEQISLEGSEREVARLGSLGLPYAGAWLDAAPWQPSDSTYNLASSSWRPVTGWASQFTIVRAHVRPASGKVTSWVTILCVVATKERG